MSLWGTNNPNKTKYSYVGNSNINSNLNSNKISKFAKNLIKSDIDKINGDLIDDYELILKNNCFYLPNFLCEKNDLTLFNRIISELKENDNENNNNDNRNIELIRWSKHFKHENPTFSKTFNDIIEKVRIHYNIEIYQTRLNYYSDGKDYKPKHKDSHAYGGKHNLKEDFTVGISLGASRELEFTHDLTGKTFKFPQNNGDLFAFTTEVNDKFMHGIPKTFSNTGPRISIIAWGRRL